MFKIVLLCFLITLLFIPLWVKEPQKIENQPSSYLFENKITLDTTVVKEDTPIAYLEIPKLNLYQKIYSVESQQNQVDKNVSQLKETVLPDQEDSFVVLAAHSGNTKVSYFKNLNRLIENDEVNFYYKNAKYVYQVVEYFEQTKNGVITIPRRSKSIILTTCSPTNAKHQLIVIGLLKKVLK